MFDGLLRLCLITQFFILIHSYSYFQSINPTEKKYAFFSESKRLEALQQSKRMFQFGYDNYMKFAFPKDELDPIHCSGRGPDYENPSNLNINDVLGDYALTLIESLDTLAIMGNTTEFRRAVKLVIENVSFNKSSTVQVFEANIRVLGALLSAHLLITDSSHPFGRLASPSYNNELLQMAQDLGHRLLSAFQFTNTGIPHPRVNLQTGVPADSVNETCTAGAGTLRIEFGVLSRLLNDPSFEMAAKLTTNLLWSRRSNVTGLFGNVINIQTGEWKGVMSGLGAGIDSFYEYLFKSSILFGDADDLIKFNQVLRDVKTYLRKGNQGCDIGTGFPPIHVNVHMNTGILFNNWIDSLQAGWTSVQVLAGDIEEAICSHAFYYAIWLKYNALPERYNWLLHHPDVSFYPLRPEFIESTYFLYRATRNPFYLHIGVQVMHSIETFNKAKCGYATRHDVTTSELEDRMESFFLSETCKYLYLLFDEDNHINKHSEKYLFSTEGHIFPILSEFQHKTFHHHSHTHDSSPNHHSSHTHHPLKPNHPSYNHPTSHFTHLFTPKSAPFFTGKEANDLYLHLMNVHSPHDNTSFKTNCEKPPEALRYSLPIKSHYLEQMQYIIGV